MEVDNSTIGSTESTDLVFARCGFSEDLLILPKEISFDPKNQFTLHVCSDVDGLLGDENGDSGTIRTNCSDTTLGTFKTAPAEPINYLVPRSIIPTLPPTAPTQISNNNDTSNDDAQIMQEPAPTSIEVALSSRSEGFDKD